MYKVETEFETTVIKFSRPMRCISSAIFGGGIRTIKSIVNYTLQEGECPDISEMKMFCHQILINFGLDPNFGVVLLTTVPQCSGVWSKDCLVTAGLGNAVPIESEPVWDEEKSEYVYNPGTINCIHIVSQNLSDQALVEANAMVRMSIAMQMIEWSSVYSNQVCVGTPTDCTAVISPIEGPSLQFAGLATKVGFDLVRNTRLAFKRALAHKYPIKQQPVA